MGHTGITDLFKEMCYSKIIFLKDVLENQYSTAHLGGLRKHAEIFVIDNIEEQT